MTKTEELANIVTAWRFIAMLMMLLIAIMSHYGIALDSKVAELLNTFLASFIGINTVGKITDKIADALKPNNNPVITTEI